MKQWKSGRSTPSNPGRKRPNSLRSSIWRFDDLTSDARLPLPGSERPRCDEWQNSLLNRTRIDSLRSPISFYHKFTHMVITTIYLFKELFSRFLNHERTKLLSLVAHKTESLYYYTGTKTELYPQKQELFFEKGVSDWNIRPKKWDSCIRIVHHINDRLSTLHPSIYP